MSAGPGDPGDEVDDGEPAGGTEDRAREVLDHLQAAAREMIAASRSLLDLAEQVIDDPKAGEELLESLASFTRRGPSTGRDGDGGVEHIEVD